jgi:hypothetical protein
MMVVSCYRDLDKIQLGWWPVYISVWANDILIFGRHPAWDNICILTIGNPRNDTTDIETLRWPKHLESLDISNIRASQIQDLPNTLTHFNCEGCDFDILPKVPDTLVSLYCGANQRLRILPRYLREFKLRRGTVQHNANILAIRAKQRKFVATILCDYCEQIVNNSIDWLPMIAQICEYL